jgi:mannonate dehydratase
MRINDAKMIVCSPGRNFVTLKITTDEGVYGLGDATLNGRELAVASYLNDRALPLLMGRDARKIRRHLKLYGTMHSWPETQEK